MKTLFSGIKPTGQLHLGNYLGAIKNWVDLQKQYDCLYSIVDLHALTIDIDATALRKNTLELAADLLSLGIDPKKSVLFKQSEVSGHTELGWIFNCLTPVAELERMTQYKDMSARQPKNVNAGLLTYPTLQAADILLYKAECVPVGEDQLQHLELSREITRRFNSLYKKELFPEPQALLTSGRAKVLGTDGRKMSKSYDNYIAISEEPEVIERKVQSMFTDPLRIKRTDPGHPDKCNVHTYYDVFSPERKQEIDELCRLAKIGCTDCKKELAGSMIKYLEPYREKKRELLKDKKILLDILNQGERKAREVAAETIREVKELLGLTVQI